MRNASERSENREKVAVWLGVRAGDILLDVAGRCVYDVGDG